MVGLPAMAGKVEAQSVWLMIGKLLHQICPISNYRSLYLRKVDLGQTTY